MPKKPPKKPGDDAPEPEEPEDPKKGSGKRIRNPPIDITNWRQQSQNRAHERNRITYMSVDLAEYMRARRVDKGHTTGREPNRANASPRPRISSPPCR